MIGSLKKLFDGSRSDLKNLEKKSLKVQNLSVEISKLTDDDLKNKTVEFKNRYKNGESLDGLLVESFAVVREASKRVLGLYPYHVQIMGGISLHEGNISEMKTGEGKTLTSTMPVYLNAISGKGVHVVTVNDYLAARDAEEMGKLYNFLGLTVGLNLSNMSNEEKKEAYNCDITYSTNNELGFDYLRDNMVSSLEERVQRSLYFAVIDEVDSILIDEARTPLIISGDSENATALYIQCDLFVKNLKQDVDYILDEKIRSVHLTERGISKAEKHFDISNLFDIDYVSLNHHISQALKAHVIMHRDIDYVVNDDEVVIVDQFTGRLMSGRRYSDGLHQAIEAKEGVVIQNESMTLATITFQNYFRMYEKLSGMTGTAKTEEEEFRNIYNMRVISIPTNKPVIREDRPDLIFSSMENKFKAVVDEVIERHLTGQPVLVGTVAIENSELISKLLTDNGIPHNVLNAKNHEREAEIISFAGQKGAITIATNMAGRGTDIKLGNEVRELGGLAVIGTERHESRRIDDQLRGRSGRQGDPGISQFYISMEDELMVRFGTEKLKHVMNKLGMDSSIPLQSKMINKAVESAQKRVEGNNFDIRKQLLQYDEVLRQQREIIYENRNKVLELENLRPIAEEMVESYLYRNFESYIPSYLEQSEWDLNGLLSFLNNFLFKEDGYKLNDFTDKSYEDITAMVFNDIKNHYDSKEFELSSDIMKDFLKVILLRVIDNKWISHIDSMEHLREGIHLRSYGQIDPLREYQSEGFNMFEEMIISIEDEVSNYLLNLEVYVDNNVIEYFNTDLLGDIEIIEGSGLVVSESFKEVKESEKDNQK